MDAQITKCLKSIKAYAGTKSFRNRLIEGDQEVSRSIQQVISQTLRNSYVQPIEKLLAVKFAKDCIETFNDKFIGDFQAQVLTLIEQIACYRAGDTALDRGKTYFLGTQHQQIGISLVQLSLECIWVWQKWFPIDPKTSVLSCYKISYMKLIKIGVSFPPISYFKKRFVIQHLPEKLPPIMLLQEANLIISKNLQMNKLPTLNTKICENLCVTVRIAVQKSQGIPIFYSDIWRRAYKKIKQQKRRTKKPCQKTAPSQHNLAHISNFPRQNYFQAHYQQAPNLNQQHQIIPRYSQISNNQLLSQHPQYVNHPADLLNLQNQLISLTPPKHLTNRSLTPQKDFLNDQQTSRRLQNYSPYIQGSGYLDVPKIHFQNIQQVLPLSGSQSQQSSRAFLQPQNQQPHLIQNRSRLLLDPSFQLPVTNTQTIVNMEYIIKQFMRAGPK